MEGKTRHIRLSIGYDGTEFSGWQKQINGRTIQGEIEQRLSIMTCEPVTLHGAGRTDAGVHAEEMTAHFSTFAAISCEAFLQGLNSLLPPSIRIYDASEVDETFHARFSATGKEYNYFVFTGKIQNPLQRLYSYHYNYRLNLQTVQRCLEIICGTHDFSTFENSGTRDKTIHSARGAVRTIFLTELRVTDPESLMLRFVGDGFLKNMIRNLVGTILEAGRGKYTPSDFQEMLLARNRSMAGPTAPARGLQLKKVFYKPLPNAIFE